ncbi:MAG: nucleotidyltransferase domain-containing protein [Ignavibacteriaceae bacterium]|nr:nucleotidyltransferase domain-containing protein [Ignavibacteriaceae bacterium]
MVGISGREIARISKLSNRTAQNVLANLESLGLVNRAIGGRDHLFTLNRSNKIVTKLIKYIFEFEDGFRSEILSLIKKKLSTVVSSLILFGSVARNDEDYTSDFDLCIVYTKHKTKIENIVSQLRDKLYDDYKVTLAPFYITESDFRKRAQKNLSPVNNIIKDGVLISGRQIRELIK